MSKQNQVVINFRDSTKNNTKMDELVTKEIFPSKSDLIRTAVEKLLLENTPSANAKSVNIRIPNKIFHWINKNIIGPGEELNFETLIIRLLHEYRNEGQNEIMQREKLKMELEKEHATVSIRKKEIEAKLEMV